MRRNVKNRLKDVSEREDGQMVLGGIDGDEMRTVAREEGWC